MKRKTKCPAKKPRTLNAVWADARCEPTIDRIIALDCNTELTAKQALRLSQWLAEAAAWKAEE